MADPPEREVGKETSRVGGNQDHEVASEGEDVADPPEGEVGERSSQDGGYQVQVQDGKKKASSPEAGQARLSQLRKRMETEKLRVIRYLDNKKEGKKEWELLAPDGWMDWWKMINLEEEKLSKRRKKLQQAGKAKKTFEEQVLPNQALVGWRGWWSRMEAESRKDGKERKRVDDLIKAKEGMQPIETYFKCLKSKMESGGKVNTGIFSSLSSGQVSSPKRKFIFKTSSVEPSPGKKRKLNFTENLSFWRTMEGGGDMHSQLGPTNSAVRNILQTKITHEQNDLEVVIGWGSPGRDRGLMQTKTQTNGDEP